MLTRPGSLFLRACSMEIELACKDCPVHCDEGVEEINATAEASIRHWSLGLSCLATTMILANYIYCWNTTGKIMPVPEIVWAICLSPMGSATVQKIFDFFGKKK